MTLYVFHNANLFYECKRNFQTKIVTLLLSDNETEIKLRL